MGGNQSFLGAEDVNFLRQLVQRSSAKITRADWGVYINDCIGAFLEISRIDLLWPAPGPPRVPGLG